MRRVAALLGTAAILATAGPAAADDFKSDARCLVAFSYFLGTAEDDEASQARILASGYYLGRLDGKSASYDLEATMRAAIADIAGTAQESQITALMADELPRCADTLRRRAEAMTAVRKALQGKN